jgi:hypothetical protein
VRGIPTDRTLRIVIPEWTGREITRGNNSRETENAGRGICSLLSRPEITDVTHAVIRAMILVDPILVDLTLVTHTEVMEDLTHEASTLGERILVM